MRDTRSEHVADELLAQAKWIRGLARSLVRDPNVADDVAQDACLSALERAPNHPDKMRSWLRTVVRNVVTQRARSESRRRAREQVAAAPELQPSTSEVCDRLQLFRSLLAAVHALDEPYRSTLVLRYLEELPPREIARRMDIPVKTVHTRTDRGLQRLRKVLDARFGRANWVPAVLPLLRTPPATTTSLPIAGVFLMNTKLIAGVALIAIAGLCFWSLRADGDGPEPELQNPGARLESAGQPRAVPGSRVAEPPRVTNRQAETPATKPPADRLRGRVVDLRSRPVANVDVVQHRGFEPTATAAELQRTTTDSAGMFEMPAEPRRGVLVARGQGIATVFAANVARTKDAPEPVIVVGPSVEVTGQVTDSEGRLIEDARVRIALPLDFRGRFPLILDHAVDPSWVDVTSHRGQFDLPDVVALDGARLLVTKEGYLPASEDVPRTTARLAIVLRRPNVVEGALRGLVVDALGTRVSGARVALGSRSTRTDESGGFVFTEKTKGRGKRLIAVVAGFLPAIESAPRDADGNTEDWGDFVVLRLRERAKTIRGRVVDASGVGRKGIKVWIKDPDIFGIVDGRYLPTENLIANAAALDELVRRVRSMPDRAKARRIFENTPNERWNFAITGASGDFTLDGVLPRQYVLTAIDPSTLLQIDSAPIRGGDEGVRIVIPADACHDRVRGRVVDSRGDPVAGVRVRPYTNTSTLTVEGRTSTMHQDLDGTVTRKDGSFEFENVPKTRVYLRLDGPNVIPLEFGRGVAGGIHEASGGDVEAMKIRIRRRVHVQVEVPGGTDVVDGLSVLDADGKRLEINVFRGGSRSTTNRLPVRGDKSPAFVVPDTATTIVFTKNGKEVRRQPLALVPGQLNRVRF